VAPAILCFAIANEIPAPTVRWLGRKSIERFLQQIYRAVKTEDPGALVTYVISDREAEHVPKCNMAFRKSALEAVGGLDEQFRVVGDDVDLCWRVLERGWKIGLSPAAVVWHHRRNSVLMYWKQQYGYGRAEALLQQKWPEKYNVLGHSAGSGRVYGKGQMPFLGVVSRIYKSHERHCHT
jgi:GT2 family glycosyltransferase